MDKKIFMLGSRVKFIRKDKHGNELKGKVTEYAKDDDENIKRYLITLDDGRFLACDLDEVVEEE